ncbi:MAG: transglutaminase domain-containing protein, partial [Promethearchaeota archaeon]
IVEWFCEHGEGLWSEFASAFCAFTRAFNVSSRFVNGFHSQGIVPEYDDTENKWYFAIKYMNLYNWAEIFVPTSISGDGMWTQMDIIFDSFGAGGNPMANYRIKVNSNFTAGYRGPKANLTATLSSDTGSINNKRITFTDLNSGLILGEAYTDQNGTASILVNINESQVVGPHLIMASYQLANNFTSYMIYGNIQVNLTNVYPQTINRSISTTTTIQGYVYDPVANQGVRNATVEFVLLDKSTQNKIINPFDINSIDTDINGNFNEIVSVNSWVPRGNYEIRVDFNGSWGGVLLAPFGIMDNSSNKMDFTITEELTYRLLFSIDGQPTDFPFPPNPSNLINVKRGEQLNLSAILIDEDIMSPDPGEIVEFYDYTNGNVMIGTDITNSKGIASFIYDIGVNNKSGPTLVYAKYGGDFNYSYYIVNESIVFDFISGPIPREINRTGSFGTQFNTMCRLIDTSNNDIYYSEIALRMFRMGSPMSQYLNPQFPLFQDTGGSNLFTFDLGVQPDTPATNYTLRLDFDGFFDFTFDPGNPYPSSFFINDLSVSYFIPNELKVIDPENLTIYLAVEGRPTSTFYNDGYLPERYNRGETAHFQVQILHPLPFNGRTVYVYNEYNGRELDNYKFGPLDTGFVQFNISTNDINDFHAGLNRIRVEYDIFATINTTYIIINETVNINANPGTNVITRGNGGFNVYGNVEKDGKNMKGMELKLVLLDNDDNDISGYLDMPWGQYVIIQNDGTYQFQVNSINLNCPQGEYYLRVDFNGTISAPGISVTNYMINTSSARKLLNITAGTIIIQEGYHTTPHDISDGDWWVDDILYIYGNLTWDNGTAMANMKVNVTVQLLNGEIVAFNDTVVTDQYGGFNASLIVDSSWPDYVSQTKIIVYFEPKDNNLEYVDKTELQFT